MGEVIANKTLMERKHFLVRALNNHNITQEEYDAEMPELERQMAINLGEALKVDLEQAKEIFVVVKTEEKSDGNMKRAIANVLKKTLEPYFSSDEIKGIFRQGYKIMRGI